METVREMVSPKLLMEVNAGAPRKLNNPVSHSKARRLSVHCKLLVTLPDLNKIAIVLGNGKSSFLHELG